MSARVSPLTAACIGVGAALVVAALWWRRPRTPVVEAAIDATTAARVSRHDAFGMPGPPAAVRDPAKVRELVGALDVDAHPVVTCPPDYATAELGIVLSGRDVYARRNVYVWGLFSDAGSPSVVVVSSSGCRGGPPSDVGALRELIATFEREEKR